MQGSLLHRIQPTATIENRVTNDVVSCIGIEVYQVHAMKIHGRRYIDPVILNLGTGWRRVVNFTSRPSDPWGKNLGTHRQEPWCAGHFGEGKERRIRILVATASISYK